MANKLLNYQDVLRSKIKDKEFKKHYDQEGPRVQIGYKITQLRQKFGMTQQQLAKKIHTSQTVISRLESGGYWQCSLRTLDKIAKATGTRLEITFA